MDIEVGAWPIDTWYDSLDGRSQVNYGATVSAGGTRTQVFKPGYESITSPMPLHFLKGAWNKFSPGHSLQLTT